MLTRRVKLLLTGAVITLGLLATILVDAPAPTMTVDELIAEASEGRDVAVRGEVLDGSIDNGTSSFVLEGESATLTVSFLDATVSNGLGDNRTVYAEGTLTQTADGWVLEATTIKTSCPSKYEEEATTD
ncbi:MAG: cytochrome c maturation protein CcmE [Candidatus Poseidoniaceae archaeon]